MKLVSSVPFDEGQLRRLAKVAPHFDVSASNGPSPAETSDPLDEETEIYYSFRAPKDLLDRAPNLRWLQLMGAGTDHLAGHPATSGSIVITNCSGIGATPIAEHVLAMMLAFSRMLPTAFRGQQQRTWVSQDVFNKRIREVRGRTVGIVGYGSIGREVARLAKPFGTKILAVKRSPHERAERGYAVENTGDRQGELADAFFGPGALHEVLPQCDYVVLAMPLTQETERMFGAREFEAMKPRAVLINIARGRVLDEAALLGALRENRIGGAALDVFDTEPLSGDSPFWALENVIVTPHVAGSSRPYLRRAFEVLTTNLGRYVKDQALLNIVDPRLGY